MTVAALCLITSAPAHAQIHNIMTFGGFQFTPDADFVFTANSSGGGSLVTQSIGTRVLSGGPIAASYAGIAYLQFGPISQINGTATASGSNIKAQFSGGSFLISTGPSGGGLMLLTGTFGGSEFNSTSSSGATLQSLTFGNVSYTGGSYLINFLSTYKGTSAIGSFSLGLTAITPKLKVNALHGLNSFKANGSGGTFDATSIGAVPEPGEYMVMGMAGMTVCGLIVRTRRRRNAGERLS